MAETKDSIDTKTAKTLFEVGALSCAVAVPAPLEREGYWLLQFQCENRRDPYTLAAQREDRRVFKSADGVLSTALKIGFREVKFKF